MLSKSWFPVGVFVILALLCVVVVLSYGTFVHAQDDGGNRQSYGVFRTPMTSAGINIRDRAGNDIARVTNDETTWGLFDHLGSLRIEAAQPHEYGPYGATANGTATYAGHPYDPHQSLYQSLARDYEPSLGRFLGVDSQRQSASPYPYAGGDPVGNVDPTGDIYVPFFIRSGFTEYQSGYARTSFSANSIKSTLNSTDRQRYVYPDHSFFDYVGNRKPGEVFAQTGLRLVRFSDDATEKIHHDDTLYWLVGKEESVFKPLDVAATFDQWRSLRPGIASKIVIIDTSGDEDRSFLIRQALGEANINYKLIRAPYTVEQTSPRTQQVNLFLVGDDTMRRSDFRSHTRGIVASMDTPMRPEPGAVPVSSVVSDTGLLEYDGIEQHYQVPIQREENPYVANAFITQHDPFTPSVTPDEIPAPTSPLFDLTHLTPTMTD